MKKSKPKFALTMLMKNEVNCLPRLFNSLTEFIERGGEIFILDTGSIDGSIEYCESKWAKVIIWNPEEYKFFISEELSDKVNEMFIINNEWKISQGNSYLFNFSKARNFITSQSTCDFNFHVDCDEQFTNLNIDKINSLIEEGHPWVSYNFIFSHNSDGSPYVQFIQCKLYDRRIFEWKGLIHEMLHTFSWKKEKKVFVDREDLLLEHFQNHKTQRNKYTEWLAVDCYLRPENNSDNYSYVARELLFSDKFHSALNCFKKHIVMDGGSSFNKGQTCIYMGNCILYLANLWVRTT